MSEEITKAIDKLTAKIPKGMALTLGWAWAEACTQLDRGDDPREQDMAELLPRAFKDLEEELNKP